MPAAAESSAPAPAAPAFSPLYQQIKSLLLKSLSAGEWLPGQVIPSEVELAARFGVSQGTVRKAIDEMATENVLVDVPAVVREMQELLHASTPQRVRVTLDPVTEPLWVEGDAAQLGQVQHVARMGGLRFGNLLCERFVLGGRTIGAGGLQRRERHAPQQGHKDNNETAIKRAWVHGQKVVERVAPGQPRRWLPGRA